MATGRLGVRESRFAPASPRHRGLLVYSLSPVRRCKTATIRCGRRAGDWRRRASRAQCSLSALRASSLNSLSAASTTTSPLRETAEDAVADADRASCGSRRRRVRANAACRWPRRSTTRCRDRATGTTGRPRRRASELGARFAAGDTLLAAATFDRRAGRRSAACRCRPGRRRRRPFHRRRSAS